MEDDKDKPSKPPLMEMGELAEKSHEGQQAWLATATDEQLKETLANHYNEQFADYDSRELYDLVCEWSNNGTRGVWQHERVELLEQINEILNEISQDVEGEGMDDK